ncbi:hypothetical protein C5167_039241 [Papaver somniferum]|uniref:Uncharacterized protein n=1 Tax=Papaver somniferum TaxID=3469 RepID=A0A4Y7IBS7_PAPSO|nr:hypothetical protein C5167_039241 [Papaver somniferum]
MSSSSSSSTTTTTTRPVPRRESPWGRPEGDTRQPKAHRCNDRAEDFVQACFEGNPFKTVPGPFKLFYRCMRSKPGGWFSTKQRYTRTSQAVTHLGTALALFQSVAGSPRVSRPYIHRGNGCVFY